ncbi:non-specific lipid transfer protein GPI-anchored 9 isoform X2 [Cicer arietinum]|uniref:non-specific lipid transfer protein GPI-anchored 9 isoform X2 n=1 Tax=Cicer arietinum TaxID=3827 RepID=UPI003CC54DB1
MVTSKAFLSFLLINLFSNFHLCFSDGLDSLLSGIVMKDAQCMQKLLPCQPYLKNPTNPSPACCSPLNEIAINSSDCLCNLMNNPKLFLSLDVSKDEILKLPNACGINVDTSKCNAEGTVPTPSEANIVFITFS